MEKFGITNIKLLIGLPIELGNIGDQIGHEGGDWKKYFKLAGALDEVVDVIKVDWKQLKPEFDDLSEVEKAEIKQYLCEKFKLVDESLEIVIEKSFTILFNIGSSIKEAIELFKGLKKA